MNDLAKLRAADARMLVQLTVEELRAIVAEVVEQKLRARLSNGKVNGLLTAEQAAEFLGYSKDWVYKNWQRIGGKKKSAAEGSDSMPGSWRNGLRRAASDLTACL
jgi:hypothetical protein